MDDITELQRRIATALDRIDAGLSDRSAETDAVNSGPAVDADEFERMKADLDSERQLSAELEQRLLAMGAHNDSDAADTSDRVGHLERHVAALEAESDRLKTANAALVESNRTMQHGDDADASGALQAELDALRQVRASDRAELDALLALLAPIVERFGTEEADNA